MIKTICTGCGQRLDIPSHYLNQTVRCTKCGDDFTAYGEQEALAVYKQESLIKKVVTMCTGCGHRMKIPEQHLNHAVQCAACTESFTAYREQDALAVYKQAIAAAEQQEEAQRLEDEKRRKVESLTSVLDYLDRAGQTPYGEIEGSTRRFIESTASELTAKGPSRWSSLEAQVLARIISIPGRMEFLTLIHQSRVESLLGQLIAAIGNVERATAGLKSQASSADSKLDGMRIAANITGMNAAYELADRMFDNDNES